MHNPWHARGVWAALILLVAVVFLQAAAFDFVNIDDNRYVTENPNIQGLTAQHVAWAFTTGDVSNWHPLTWLSYMLDYTLFGLDPSGPHMVNALLHALNCILLFEWARRATGALWRSALVAALFAVHPLHVESVAWISERKDVLSACFGFSAMLAYTHYARRPALMRYLPVFVLLALGLLAKPMLVTLPFVLLLIDYWPLERFRNEHWQRLALDKVPLIALSAASSIITIYVQHVGGSVMPLERFPFGARIGNAIISYLLYLVKLLVPVNLAVFYPYPRSTALLHAAIAVVVLALVTSLVIWRARNKPYLATGWFWYAGTLVPVIGIVQVGLQSMADRYMYLPSIGLFIIAAWGGWEILQKLPRAKWAAIVLSAACVLVFTGVSFAQTRHWRDSETLLTHAIAVTTDNTLAHYNLGTKLLHDVRLGEAVKQFRLAIDIEPKHANAHNNLATALYSEGRYDEAASEFAVAIDIEPSLANGRYNYATALSALGKDDAAVAEFEAALQADPNNADIHFNYANSLLRLKKLADAEQHYREAIHLKPDYVEVHMNLGALLLQAGKADEAVAAYTEATRLDPKRAEAFANLGYALAERNRYADAATALAAAVRLDPSNATWKKDLESVRTQSGGDGPHVVRLPVRN
jgi:tetratricopeptide (TPR) repeat protein